MINRVVDKVFSSLWQPVTVRIPGTQNLYRRLIIDGFSVLQRKKPNWGIVAFYGRPDRFVKPVRSAPHDFLSYSPNCFDFDIGFGRVRDSWQ
jgi:hypothetical protein